MDLKIFKKLLFGDEDVTVLPPLKNFVLKIQNVSELSNR